MLYVDRQRGSVFSMDAYVHVPTRVAGRLFSAYLCSPGFPGTHGVDALRAQR